MRASFVLAVALLLAAFPSPARAGKLLSVELNNADIHHAIRIVAEASRLNFVVDDQVSGKVTLKLRNVPWEDALTAILRSKDLGQERTGTIVRIAPMRKLAEEKELALRMANAEKLSKPLKTRLVPVNYAKAEDLAAIVKTTLTERGTVIVDHRTNTLIVRDVE
ncbi:MAG TPA: secretin and TonB N-terminal domain-containing protein [Myxococcales bacterium]|jgi:type IV pilus assembly protein PilQ